MHGAAKREAHGEFELTSAPSRKRLNLVLTRSGGGRIQVSVRRSSSIWNPPTVTSLLLFI